MYGGSQADAALLQQVVADTAEHGLYDVIVDDGGHDPIMNLQSLNGLWSGLKSGGVYIVEDGRWGAGIWGGFGGRLLAWAGSLAAWMLGFHVHHSISCATCTAEQEGELLLPAL